MSARYNRILAGACCLALFALAMMMWSLFDPRPIPVVLAMSVGQALGTLSFATFLVVVVADVRAQIALGRRQPPKVKPPEPETQGELKEE